QVVKFHRQNDSSFVGAVLEVFAAQTVSSAPLEFMLLTYSSMPLMWNVVNKDSLNVLTKKWLVAGMDYLSNGEEFSAPSWIFDLRFCFNDINETTLADIIKRLGLFLNGCSCEKSPTFWMLDKLSCSKCQKKATDLPYFLVHHDPHIIRRFEIENR